MFSWSPKVHGKTGGRQTYIGNRRNRRQAKSSFRDVSPGGLVTSSAGPHRSSPGLSLPVHTLSSPSPPFPTCLTPHLASHSPPGILSASPEFLSSGYCVTLFHFGLFLYSCVSYCCFSFNFISYFCIFLCGFFFLIYSLFHLTSLYFFLNCV